MKVQYFVGVKTPTTGFVDKWLEGLRAEVERLQPECPPELEDNFPKCREWCEHASACKSAQALRDFFIAPNLICMCSEGEHRDCCPFGAAGKKLRRRVEDRLRKDLELTHFVGEMLGLY